MSKIQSIFSKFSPRNIINKWKKTLKIIFTKNIDTSTEEGRMMKREKAMTLTALTASIAKIIALLIPFITVKVTRGYLGEEIYGLWSSVNSFFAFFAFADLGLGSGLQTNLSKASGKNNNEDECKKLISSTFVMLFAVAGSIIFLFLGCYYFVDWASLVGANSPEAIALAGPVFLSIVIPKLINIPVALTQRTQVALQEGYNYYSWSLVGSLLSIISVYANTYLESPKVVMILCSAAIPTVIELLNFIYYFCISKRRQFFPRLKYFSWLTCKAMLGTGFGFLIIHILMNFGLSNMDSFIVGNVDNLSMAGDYSICLKVAAVINVIATMFGLPLWGVYGEALEHGDVQFVKKHVVKRAFFMLGLTLFASLCGMIMAPIAFKLIVGNNFSYNPWTLLGMFLLQSSFGCLSSFFMILNGTGKIRLQIIAYGIFAPVSFILKWILAPKYGVDIMPWITTISYIIVMYPLIIYSAYKVINTYEKKNDKKIKFVVVKPPYSNVYDYCYKDLENMDDVDLLDDYIKFKSPLEKKIYNKHFTKKIWLPFRCIWNKKYFLNKFDKNDRICFLTYIANNGAFKYGAIKYLKRKYLNSKVILILTDLVDVKYKTEKDKKIFKQFDYIFSFDHNDCEKYGFYYHPLVYSRVADLGKNVNEDIDVYFCGKEKNRYDLIVETYNFLTDHNLKCQFFIHGVKKEKRINKEGLIHLDKIMSYDENLKYIQKSKCILEIMQDGGQGYTLRTCEAVAYDKKIISNNKNLGDFELFDDKMMYIYENVNDINIEWIKNKSEGYKNNSYFSPLSLLKKVEHIVSQGDN